MQGFQIPRNSLTLMLIAQAAVIVPHVFRLPIWLTLLCAACCLWRVRVYQGKWSYPGRWIKTLFVFGGFLPLVLVMAPCWALSPGWVFSLRHSF